MDARPRNGVMMAWTRDRYEPPPGRREYEALLSGVDELSEQVADQAQKIFDLQIQVNDLNGQVSTLEEALGWMEAETK